MRNIIIGPVTPVIDLLDEFEENKSTCNRIVTQQIGVDLWRNRYP